MRSAAPGSRVSSSPGPARPIAPAATPIACKGPTFLIEFNNTQNGANHIHSVWRNMLGDFGIPLASK